MRYEVSLIEAESRPTAVVPATTTSGLPFGDEADVAGQDDAAAGELADLAKPES